MTPELEGNWSYLSVKLAVLAAFQNKISFFCHFIWLRQGKQFRHLPTHLLYFLLTVLNLSIPANCSLIFLVTYGPPDNCSFRLPHRPFL